MRRAGATWAAIVACAAALLVPAPHPAAAGVTAGAPAPASAAARDPRPLIAYYYIWFNESSWERAKRDYPAIGRYSSDDESVLRRHVLAAKAAGITAFAVSWKSTEVLDRRLELLMRVAREESFKLAIVYQGLDVRREPLPIERIAEDLDLFAARYAMDPVFDLYDKPLVIWSGTWEFTPHEVELVTRIRQEELLLLATERSVRGYERLRSSVDGNAYYWSSVNPDTFPDYPGKLRAMADVVREDKGLWLAPVAPGFDARAIGGRSVVPRRGDQTLRRQWATALESDPDALALISWNEFTENTHVEPSVEHRDAALRAIADLRGAAPLPPLGPMDSSDPGQGVSVDSRVYGAMLLLSAAGVLALAVRRRRHGTPDQAQAQDAATSR